MFRLSRILVMALSALSAVSFSQVPEFTQQYRQRLNGAVDELARVVMRFDADARAEGLGREAALTAYQDAPSGFLNRRGETVRVDIERLGRLSIHADDLERLDPIWRPLLVAREADRALLGGTLRQYRPALPLGLAGLVYGAVGLLAGLALSSVGLSLLGRIFGRRRTSPAL